MLGVGGAAAIADDQKLVAGAQRRDDGVGDLARGGEQRRILRRALERCERSLKMGCDRIVGFWLKTHRQWVAMSRLW